MSFEDQRVDLFRSFQTKYGLVPGFQGDYDLRSLFGDLVDDPSFVRDRLCPLIMVILEGLYREEDLPVLNVYMYTKFAPNLQIGHNMNPAKIDNAFQFLARSLTLLRRPEGKDFIAASPLPLVYPSMEHARSFRMEVFSTVFDIILTSDFDQIFKTIDLEDKNGFTSLRDRKLIPRSGEPPFDGRILGEPAEDHYDDLLQRYVNAGTSNMMIVSVGTATFNNSLDRNDTDSVNTGPFPIVASPEEIVQARRLQNWIKSDSFSPLFIPLGPLSNMLLKLPLVEVRLSGEGFLVREAIPQDFRIDHRIMTISTYDQWKLIYDNILDFDVLNGDLSGFFTYVKDPLMMLHYQLQRSPDNVFNTRGCEATKYPVLKPPILLKDPNRVDRRELEAARSQYQKDLDAFVDHCFNCEVCRHRFGRCQIHEIQSPLTLGVMSRACVEYIKTHMELHGRGVPDPIRPGSKIDGYTVVANGVLLSSYLRGAVGKYCHIVVGRGSIGHEDEDEEDEDRPPYFRGYKAVEGMVFGHFVSTIPPKSHGTLALRIDCVHEFGHSFMRAVAKHIQHRYSPLNYPVDDLAGNIYVKVIEDLIRPFLMYSPAHAGNNTRDMHVQENFTKFKTCNALNFCTVCHSDVCFVNANCIRATLCLAWYIDHLKSKKLPFSNICGVFGVKFVDDLLQRHVRPRNSDGSYTVRAIPSKVIGGLSEGTAFVEQMWTDPIPAWMLKREVSPKVSGRE